MKYFEFENQDKMPVIGFGTWKLQGPATIGLIREAINLGYRHIDCAIVYGNENVVGQAIEEAIKAGDVNREDLWVTSKLWSNYHQKERVKLGIETSLRSLRLDYLDLYLVHWPTVLKPEVTGRAEKGDDLVSLEECSLIETWSAFEELKEDGYTKHIGISNFSVKKMKDLFAQCSVRPEMLQLEMHPFIQNQELLDFCRKEGVYITASSPLGSKDSRSIFGRENDPVLLDQPLIRQLAEKYSCNPAQILLAWGLGRGTAVVPKSANVGRLKENLDSLNFQLSSEDMGEIKKIDRHFRYIGGEEWVFDDGPYTLANIWDE